MPCAASWIWRESPEHSASFSLLTALIPARLTFLEGLLCDFLVQIPTSWLRSFCVFRRSPWRKTAPVVFTGSGKLADNNIVEIKNVNGWIEADSTGGDQVEVSADKSGPDADQVKIQVVPHSEGVTICAIYPHSSSSCEPGE